jgi:hypothetical protein
MSADHAEKADKVVITSKKEKTALDLDFRLKGSFIPIEKV